MSARRAAIDPATLTIIQQKLDGITHRMGAVMTRTARSAIASQAHDFSCFLTDDRARLLSQAEGIPIHTGGGGFAVRALLEFFGDDIRDGDIFVSNDVYTAGGNHLPDWTVFAPVFAGNDPAAFTCIRSHQFDIGGGAAGTYNPEAKEIFHEGLRIPPLKLEDRGVPRADVLELLKINCRRPDILAGDLGAMVGSVKKGLGWVEDLLKEHGWDRLRTYCDALLDYGEHRMRLEVEDIPDGVYEAADAMNNDCFSDRSVSIRLRLTVRGGEIEADFTGTDPQIPAYKNSNLPNTYSAVYAALATVVDPQIPHNEGMYRTIRVSAPEGTVVNCTEPAPVSFATIHPAHEIMHCCWKALALADPDRVCGGWGKMANPVLSGRDRNGRVFVLFNLAGLASAGAAKGKDGTDQIGTPINMGGMIIPNLESLERLNPVRFVRHEVRRDSCGPGEFRGGTGVDYQLELLAPGTLYLRGEGQGDPSGYGTSGGKAGAPARVSFRPDGGPESALPAYGVMGVGPGVLRVQSAGSGGWGDPAGRDPSKVLQEVRDGILSPEKARADYGIEVDENAGGKG
ncbi:MAG: hydantoinase B/oxoprolinase family protein [Nitrospinota bacterium]|nr:hydantoinase B/oxoprolinase family protein [Nitrospinota bacterium]